MLFDSLDHTLIYSIQTGGDFLAITFALLPLAWIGWQSLKKRLSWQQVRLAIAFGAAAAILQGSYVLLRLDRVTVTSKPVAFSLLSILAVFTLSACAALIFFRSRSWIGRVIALLVATFPSWAPMLFGLIVVSVFNQLYFRPQLGAALYNQALFWLPIGAFLFTFTLSGLLLSLVRNQLKG
jgi:hypothetical protein